MRPNENSTKQEMMAWIDYLETKIDRIENDREYLQDRVDGLEDFYERDRDRAFGCDCDMFS
jgi:hypothetical protein